MKKILFLWLMLMSLYADDGSKKVVYDLTTGSIEKLSLNILSGIVFQKSHYESNMEELHVMVVVHGDAYKFFLNSLDNTGYESDLNLAQQHPELLKRLESLHKNYGVVFKICQAGLKAKKLSPSQVVSYAELIPSSTTGLIDAQNSGYAYIPTH